MEKIEPEHIVKLAELSRLEVGSELEAYINDLTKIISHIDQLQALELKAYSDDSPATKLRDDKVAPSLPKAAALENAQAGFEIPSP